jgi:hypothetical protein
MRTIIFALGLTLALAAAPPLSRAAEMPDVQKLLEECNAAPETQDFFYCIGYIGGIGDAMRLNGIDARQRALSPMLVSICDEGSISYGAMIQAFKNWGQEHPETWGFPQYRGVATALRETWPCKAN